MSYEGEAFSPGCTHSMAGRTLGRRQALRSHAHVSCYSAFWAVGLSAAGLLQDVLIRMKDSVVGALKPDFFEKTIDNADL